jgi:hypothetical protein
MQGNSEQQKVVWKEIRIKKKNKVDIEGPLQKPGLCTKGWRAWIKPPAGEPARPAHAVADGPWPGLYCASFAQVPKRIVLDIDDTFDAVHGGQQLRLPNAHYDGYGFQPIPAPAAATPASSSPA